MSYDLEAAFAEAQTQIEEAEREMLQRHQVSSGMLNDSGYDLTANTPLGGENGRSITIDKDGIAKQFSKDDDSKISSRFRSISKRPDENLSSYRSRQRPRTNPASKQHISKFPSTGRVSSIIGRFEQSRPEKTSSVSASRSPTGQRHYV